MLVDSSTVMYWACSFVILVLSDFILFFFVFFDGKVCKQTILTLIRRHISGSTLFAYGPFMGFQVIMG